MNITKLYIYSMFATIILVAAITAAPSGLVGVKCAVAQMCSDLKSMLPIVAMLMVIGAGVIYAAGQLMGAETRARATTWATAMLLGAVMGMLIVVVAPTIIDKMYGGTGGSAINIGLCDAVPAGC